MAKITFKRFLTFVEHEGDMTDEQITEIFGLFRNNQKLDALKKQKADLQAKRDASKKKDQLFAQRAAELRNNGGMNPLERGSATMRSQQAMGRAAERDWVSGMTEAADSEDPNVRDRDLRYGYKFGQEVRAGEVQKLSQSERDRYSPTWLRGYDAGVAGRRL